MRRVRWRRLGVTVVTAVVLALSLTPAIESGVGDALLLAQTAPFDTGLLPAEKFFEGWSKSGGPKLFTKADLYGRIDGSAEVFLEIGFDHLRVQSRRTAPAGPEIVVEIYRMRDATAARGIYLSTCGAEKRDATFRERHTINRYQLMFQRDRYFVIIANTSGKETLQPALATFGGALVAQMPADGAVTKIVVTYPTPAAATAALRNIKARLDSYLKPTLSTTTRLVFRVFEKKYGSVQLEGSRIEIRLHMTVEPK